MSEAKKIKLDSVGSVPPQRKPKNGKAGKRNYYAKIRDGNGAGDVPRERNMKPGHRGILVTCNGHVRDCVRDSYRILNEYADELYGPVEKPSCVAAHQPDEASDEEDISVKLQKEAEAACQGRKASSFRFQSVESGAMNCLFIQTALPDPNELVVKLMKDLSLTKKHKSRFILRMLPIQAVCRANLKDIMDVVGSLGDRYFLKEPKTYAIIFNRRLNNDLSRDDVIRELADLITAKNVGNKTNLKNPELAVIVEVIKGLCCIGILPEYYQLRKYNVVELVATRPLAASNPAKAKVEQLTVDSTGEANRNCEDPASDDARCKKDSPIREAKETVTDEASGGVY
uniref:THUMP domain-containing protein n=1 Tax=Anopheles epiroticus TaxID=199890 RepID=A0A182PA06_9DIPT